MTAIIDTADAVVALINDEAFSNAPESFTAAVAYRPVKKLKDITSTMVTVIPASESMEPATRGSDQHELVIWIAIQRMLENPDSTAEVNTMLRFVEEMRDRFNRENLDLDGLGEARYQSMSIDPLYVQEHLRTQGVFTSAIAVTYRLNRS